MKQKTKHLQSLLLLLILTVVGTANAWGADATYVPQGLKTVTSNETVYCTSITSAGTPAKDWVIVPNYGTSSAKYTNTTSDTYGNPNSITDNITSINSNVNMIQIKADGNTLSDNKRVVHMHLKGITGVIGHGYTGSSGRGMAIACTEYVSGSTTTMASASASVTRTNSGGSFICQVTGLDASKEYIVSFYAVSNDVFFYCAELIAGSTTAHSITLHDNNGGSNNGSATATEGSSSLTSISAPTKTGYHVDGYYKEAELTNLIATAAGALQASTDYTNSSSEWTSTGNQTLYAKWTLNVPTFSPASGSRINPTDNVTISGIPSSYVYAAWGASAIDAATLTVEGNKKTFNGSGNFTAGASGTGTRVLSARAYDGTLYSDVVSATYYIRTANTLALSTSSGSVTVGDGTLDISGYVTNKNNTSTTVTYTSNDGSVATVSSAGVITPVAAGTTTITVAQVQTDDYTAGSATFTVTVNAAATTYSVTYNGQSPDDGSAPTDTNSPYAAGSNVTVLGNTGGMTKSYKDFVGWNTSTSGTFSTHYNAGATYSSISSDVTFYAVWHNRITYSVAAGQGSVSAVYGTDDPYYGKSAGAAFTSGDHVPNGVVLTFTATPATGYHFDTSIDKPWGGTSNKNNPITWTVTDTKGFDAHFVANTYSITLNANGGSAAGSATATYKSNALTSVSAPTYADMVVEGYYEEAECTNKIADASGNLQANTTYTDASGNWTNDGAVTLYAKWEAAPSSITDLPVTIDFGASPFSTSTDFSGASGKTMSLTQNSHEVYFHGSNQTEFSIVSGSPNALRMNSNGATNHFIAIPMSNINGRIDIEVWAPYTDESNFTIRAVLDTDHGTTVQSAAPSAIKTAALDVNDYKDGHFYFRMKDITATSGVLYIGPASSSYKDYQKIRVTSPAHYLIPDKESVTMGDGSEPETVTITNYSAYPVLLKTVPSYVTATFEPSTGVLVITPKAIGTGGAIELAVDTNGDGIATSTDLSIPITVTGITIGTQPVSAVYKEGGAITALSVSATNSGEGSLTHQWYKNTVNSTTGGEKVGSNSARYTPSLTAEANAFYYCEVSADGAKTKTSDVAYVLYSNSKRYFQMSNVAGNKSTSETSAINITGQVVAGGVATYTKNTGDGKYVLRVNTQPHYFHANGDAVFKIELPSGTSVKSDDVISVTLNAINGITRGLTISASSDFSSSTDFTTSSNEGTVVAKTGSAANLTGATALYIKGYNGADGYFTDLILRESAPLVVTAPTPASQSIQTGDTPAAISVTATGGSGNYTYHWYSNSSASTSGATPISGATNASYIPTATSGTTYYYCLVNSQTEPTDYASVTFTVLSHGYMTIDGTAHAGQTYSFDNNEFKYLVNQSNYNSQNVTITDGQNQKFWELDSSPKWATKDPYTNAADIKAGSNAKFVNLYIKDAVAFKVLALNSASRTYDIYVDGKKVATSQSANPSIESPIFALNKGGSKIEFNNAKEGDSDTDVQIAYIIFYEKAPATINVLKNGEEVTEATQYMGDGATEYEVETNGDGILSLVKPTGATDVTNGYRTTYAEVTLNNGILRVTPLAATPTTPTSTPETITINHTSGTSYADASTTLDVTVKKHTLALAFSYEKASFKASTLTESTVIPSGSLPTLTATVDGEAVDIATLGIQYKTDDRTIGYFGTTDSPASSRSADGTSYAVKYGGGQGGARIYAYVDNQLNPNYSSAKAYFDLVVEAGTSNAIPKSISIDEQQVFKLANSAGVEVVKLTYGGYKYNHEGGWRNSASRGKYYIDGYQYYTRHGMDALDEYGYQLRGMSDEAQAAPSGSESGDKITVTKKKAKKDGSSSVTFDVYKYSSQNVGNHTFWYTEAETRPDGQHYLPYQRIRPFTLPTRGGYLKFEPKQTGKLTVYVWQNGQMEAKDSSNPDRVGSKPRLGYWFDQNGWVQKPVVAPITKQPITSESFASDVWAGGVRAKMENIWTTTDDIPAINMLTYQYCDDAENPTAYYAESSTGHTDLNPYFWKTRAQVRNNLNEETTIISEKMTPAPYHNGYLVPEESYLKYVINVVAGKSYYFYGMMTKIGYVGMNFVEDDNVTISDTGKKFYHETTPLHLNANDNMETVVANSVQGDANTYLGTAYDEVTLPSNYKKGQWSTICLPFSLTEEQVEEAFGVGTQLTIYNGAIKKSEGIFSVKYLSHVDRNILAGQPYFIKPSGVDANGDDLENVGGVIGSAVEGASGTRITFNTVCIDSNFSTTTTYGSDEDVNESGEDIHQKGYKFVGAYNNETLPTYSFIVSKGELRRFTGSTSKIPTYYAYLKPNTDAARSGSYSMDVPFTDDTVETAWVIDGGDDPTDVISMEAITDAMNNGRVITNGKAYNMMGQEIDPTSAKGIVIINGKKYMFE